MASPVRELIVRLLRATFGRVRDLRVALGAVLIAAAAVAALGLWGFAVIAEEVREGTTQRFDEAALRAIDAIHAPWLDPVMLEITALGNGTTVLVLAGVAALFLWLTRHRYSAALLVAAAAGGQLIALVLKEVFERPRPGVVEAGTTVHTSSFPSGHATSAAVVYFSVAYLAARLQRRRWSRVVTFGVAALVVALIAFSRLVLGVHYPSDVAAGVTLGLAWAAFCMATLEAIERFIIRDAPAEAAHEEPTPEGEAAEEEREAAERGARRAG